MKFEEVQRNTTTSKRQIPIVYSPLFSSFGGSLERMDWTLERERDCACRRTGASVSIRWHKDSSGFVE